MSTYYISEEITHKYFQVNYLEFDILDLQGDIDAIANWVNTAGLTPFNQSKTKLLLLSRKRQPPSIMHTLYELRSKRTSGLLVLPWSHHHKKPKME